MDPRARTIACRRSAPGPCASLRKMRRDPVEYDADTPAMQVIDEVHEILRRSAVTRARREVAGHLIAPRAVERVLHDGHQFHVREAEFQHVVGERVRQLAIAERPVVLLRDATPGARMQLVDRPGSRERVVARAPLLPGVIAPRVPELRDHRRGAWRHLGAKSVRIALVDGGAVAGHDAVLVERTGTRSCDAALPDSGRVRARQPAGRGPAANR